MNGGTEPWDEMLASMRAFFSTLPEASAGELVERDGVLATVVPAVPERSLPNSVIYESEDALLGALPELARIYDDAGVLAWTVWTPAHDARARKALAAAGHELDADPAAMIASLDEIEPPRPEDPEPVEDPTLDELARVNDLAYGTGDAFARIMGSGPADPRDTYLIRAGGEPVASVVSYMRERDCSIWWVAAIPEVRGRGFVSALMRRALHDGRHNGCELSTLQATKLGQPVYERLGYRAFGSIEMWERRRS